MALDKSVQSFDYPVIDTDAHIFDPPEIFTKFMAETDLKELRALVPDVPESRESSIAGPVYGYRGKNRGMSYRMHMDWADSGLTNVGDPDYTFPGCDDGQARLKCMDEEGIDSGIIRNTIFPHLGMFMLQDNNVVAKACSAYNDWVHDFCSADPTRLFPEAALPFGDVEATIKEIERTAAMGFKSTCISGSTSAPAPLSDARWDPIWARLQELGWPLCIHAGFTPAVDSSSKWLLDGKLETSSGGAYFNMNFTMNFVLDNMVTMGEVTLGGMCDKFPSLNIYFIESGHSWAGETLYRLDKVFDCPFEEYMPNGLPNAKTRPSEIFQRQMFVPYEGGDQWMAPIFNKMKDNLIWASDIPHWDADGPWEAAGALRALGVSPEIERKIMGGNAAKLLNVPYEKKVRTAAAA